jgi:hypothetical protein
MGNVRSGKSICCVGLGLGDERLATARQPGAGQLRVSLDLVSGRVNRVCGIDKWKEAYVETN